MTGRTLFVGAGLMALSLLTLQAHRQLWSHRRQSSREIPEQQGLWSSPGRNEFNPQTLEQWRGVRWINGAFPQSIRMIIGVTTGHSASKTISQKRAFLGCSHVVSRFER